MNEKTTPGASGQTTDPSTLTNEEARYLDSAPFAVTSTGLLLMSVVHAKDVDMRGREVWTGFVLLPTEKSRAIGLSDDVLFDVAAKLVADMEKDERS